MDTQLPVPYGCECLDEGVGQRRVVLLGVLKPRNSLTVDWDARWALANGGLATFIQSYRKRLGAYVGNSSPGVHLSGRMWVSFIQDYQDGTEVVPADEVDWLLLGVGTAESPDEAVTGPASPVPFGFDDYEAERTYRDCGGRERC